LENPIDKSISKAQIGGFCH